MSIIDTLRFRNILVNGDVAEEAVAQELVTALDETFEEQLDGLATKQDVQSLGTELRAELHVGMAQLREEMRALEVRLMRFIVVTMGVQLTALAIAVAIILGTR